MGYNTGMGIAGAGTGAKVGTMIAPGIGTGLGAAIGALAGLFGGGGDSDPTQNLQKLFQAMPQLRQLLNLQTQQAERSDPLHAALVQLSTNLLPRSARAPYAGVPNALTGTPWSPSGATTQAAVPRANRRSDLV